MLYMATGKQAHCKLTRAAVICASTTIYKVDCYAQNIVITAVLVNLQCACLPVAIYSTCTLDDGWDCHPKHVE